MSSPEPVAAQRGRGSFRRRHPRIATGVAAVAAFALMGSVAACATQGGGGGGGAGGDEKIRLKIATFNNFGYTELYKEYMEENPNIEIVEEVFCHASTVGPKVERCVAQGPVGAAMRRMSASSRRLSPGTLVRRDAWC